jgi:hypothetical protein
MSPMLADLDSKFFRENSRPSNLKLKQKKYLEIIDALFSLCNASDSFCTATAASSLFVSLNYTFDYESLSLMFRGSFEKLGNSSVSFSKSKLFQLCQDSKVDNCLKVLLQGLKDMKNYEKSEFDAMVVCIKKWWARLDLSKNGFVLTEDVLQFLISLNIFENSVHVRKSFTKMNIFMNYLDFFSLFAKGLLKFLILSLCDDAKDRGSVAADIVINAKRRKAILNGISGGNKVFDAFLHYRRLN